MIIPNPPQSNQPVSADWGRGVIEALRRLRPHNGPGILVNQTPEGTTYSLAPKPPVRPGGGLNITAAVLCRVTGGSSADGYRVDLYPEGIGVASTSSGTLYIVEIAAAGDLPVGSLVLGWPSITITTGGNDDDV